MSSDAHLFEGLSGPNEAGLKSLGIMLAEVDQLADEIERLEKHLKVARAAMNALTHGALVDKFTEARVSEFKTERGRLYKIENYLSGSLPKNPAKREEALRWLMQNEAADLITTLVSVRLSRKQHNIVGDVRAALEKVGVDYVEDRDVHHSTLKSFARERMKSGQEVPFEQLGLSVGRYVKSEGEDEA